MIEFKRVDKTDLLERLNEWDRTISRSVLVVACGGTALTLQGYKPSTKDIDFLVPRLPEFEHLQTVLRDKLGYQDTEVGFRDPTGVYRFDLFRGNTVFQTELLDPVDRDDRHKIVHSGKRLSVGVLNSYDLIISKMFRGNDVDVQDSITLLQAEMLDLSLLADRYKESAQYYYNETACKGNFVFLIEAMEQLRIDASALKEMMKSWNPL